MWFHTATQTMNHSDSIRNKFCKPSLIGGYTWVYHICLLDVWVKIGFGSRSGKHHIYLYISYINIYIYIHISKWQQACKSVPRKPVWEWLKHGVLANPVNSNPYSFEVFNHFWWMMMDVNHLALFRILDPPIHGSCQLQKQPATLLPASSGLLCLFQTLQFQWNKKWSTIFTKITTNATPHQWPIRLLISQIIPSTSTDPPTLVKTLSPISNPNRNPIGKPLFP